MVADKSNELPAVRALCARLDLDNRVVSLDALDPTAKKKDKSVDDLLNDLK